MYVCDQLKATGRHPRTVISARRLQHDAPLRAYELAHELRQLLSPDYVSILFCLAAIVGIMRRPGLLLGPSCRGAKRRRHLQAGAGGVYVWRRVGVPGWQQVTETPASSSQITATCFRAAGLRIFWPAHSFQRMSRQPSRPGLAVHRSLGLQEELHRPYSATVKPVLVPICLPS